MPFDDGEAEGNPSNGNGNDEEGANAREPDALRQRMASRTINWAGLRYTSHEGVFGLSLSLCTSLPSYTPLPFHFAPPCFAPPNPFTVY